MSYSQRQQEGRQLCERLAERVAKVVPDGIGRWDRVWQVVDAPSAEFMLALAQWETVPTNEHRFGVSHAYDDVLDAWRNAAAEYTVKKAS